MVAGGVYVGRAAFFSLRARQVVMNVLMTLAALGAAAIGQWSEAGLVVFLFGLGTWLQVATLERTRRAISGLMALTPPEAVVLRGGAEVTVPATDIAAGDIVLIRPGERAAVDGVVLEGNAAANQAPVTGESHPVAKAPGDQVFAGSIVEGGALRIRATSGAADNTIAKIVHLVEEAQAQRAPAESIVDRFAARYTPIVVALAAAVAFDKTGTLTAGRPQVTDVVGLRETPQGRVLEIAASLERLSEHPLARAIVEHASGAHPAPAHDACVCG